MSAPLIRPVLPEDRAAILDMFLQVVARGDAYAFSPDTDEAEAARIWFAPGAHVYAAETDERVTGSFYIKPNQPGLGDHVANAGFMVNRLARGRGLGRAMGVFALDEARRLGYRAMQFNFVVATNEPALRLWKDLGFTIAGTIPHAFRHSTKGFVDVHIMHRKL